MLDFLLVLGLIPGTDFQITFYELITISLVLIGWLFRAQLRRLIAAKKTAVHDLVQTKAVAAPPT